MRSKPDTGWIFSAWYKFILLPNTTQNNCIISMLISECNECVAWRSHGLHRLDITTVSWPDVVANCLFTPDFANVRVSDRYDRYDVVLRGLAPFSPNIAWTCLRGLVYPSPGTYKTVSTITSVRKTSVETESESSLRRKRIHFSEADLTRSSRLSQMPTSTPVWLGSLLTYWSPDKVLSLIHIWRCRRRG